MPPISKTQRWLDLIAFLVQRRYPVSIDQIMEAVPAYTPKWTSGSETDRESARRMFERDKDELRALGMPLETLEYNIECGTEITEGYTLSSRDFYLPYLRIVGEESGERRGGKSAGQVEIDREDAATAVDALRRVADLPGFGLAEEARSALRKVAFDLEVDDLEGAPVLYVDRPGTAEMRDRMALLTQAVRSRKKVRFRYHGIYRGEPTQRDVAPYGLLFQHGHWYFIGHDDLRDDVRVFRLGRMEDVEVNRKAAKTPDYEVPCGFRPDKLRSTRAVGAGGGRGRGARGASAVRLPGVALGRAERVRGAGRRGAGWRQRPFFRRPPGRALLALAPELRGRGYGGVTFGAAGGAGHAGSRDGRSLRGGRAWLSA